VAVALSEPPQLLDCLKSPEAVICVRKTPSELAFVSVTACAALVVPTDWGANVREEGVRVTPEPKPVPMSFTIWGLPGALSVMTRLAERSPAAVGIKATTRPHAFPGAILAQESPVTTKSPESPVTAIFETVRAAFPVFKKETRKDWLCNPTAVAGNPRSPDG
jgi:hypothetical protein